MHSLLFVDDETDNLDALERVFRKKYTIFKANSGPQALEILKKENITVIISDQRMPDMTGVEFLEKSQKLAPHAIRILLTGYTDIDSVILAINKGHVYRYVTKPWDTRDLTLTVEQSVEKYELESELKITNQKLSQALDELKVLDEAKSRFMILINHELKTPLTTLMSFLELLEQSEPNEEQTKYLSRVRKSTDRISEIIHDSLELVTSELGKVKTSTSKIQVQKLLGEILNESAFKGHDIEIQSNDVTLTTDSKIIKNVLTRILKNAVQHGDSKEPIHVKCGKESDHVYFEITNSGKEVPQKIIDQILKPFGTNEDIMNHSKGMGLGLSICQSLLKHVESRLEIESHKKAFKVRFSIPQ